jgi:hypothetical protein
MIEILTRCMAPMLVACYGGGWIVWGFCQSAIDHLHHATHTDSIDARYRCHQRTCHWDHS